MKAHLLFADRDLDLSAELPSNAAELTQDLDLDVLFEAMSGGDAFLREVARRVVLATLDEPRAIAYRQDVLADCVAEPDVVRQMYSIAVGALADEKHVYFPIFRHPSGVLRRSVEVLQVLVARLKELRGLADANAARFRSTGFTTLFEMLSSELTDEYFHTIEEHLSRLRFRDGVLVSARLGTGNKGVRYVLRSPSTARRGLRERIGLGGGRPSYSFTIADRDEAGARALSELADRGINLVGNALAQSVDHVVDFFTMLCRELGFYVGCLNLREGLVGKGEPVCTPVPLPTGATALSARGVYDVCLTLRSGDRVVGNDVDAEGKPLVLITGANSGGKSTLLRSLGLAQLMLQSGMFVCAESFSADVRDRIFTHFIREEDVAMRSGKLDEELSRMEAISKELSSRSMVLFNESFGSTNEREGSELARQITTALLESGVKVLFVTHLYTFAKGLQDGGPVPALFLRAERGSDGTHRYRLVEGPPLPTSFGPDIYARVGGFS